MAKKTRAATAKPSTRRTVATLKKTIPESRVLTLSEIKQLRLSTQGVVRGGVVRTSGGEYGVSGTLNVFGRIYQEDYNALFDGKNGIALFDQMYRSDASCGVAHDIITFPIRQARWSAEYPKDATKKEKQIVDAINEDLFENGEWPSGESWDFYLRHLLMRVSYGFGLLNPVWMFDETIGRLRWSRLAPRLPRTVERFEVDAVGRLEAIVQFAAAPGTGIYDYRSIPAQYALLSVRDREGDNFFGKSIYRRIYKHWFYKDDAYRIDGIRLDRYGVGIPVAKVEAGHLLDSDELNEIEMTLISMRSHERGYIIEPPKVSFRIMTPDSGHGGVTGLMESVNHHDGQILRGVMATFLNDRAEGLNTNRTATLADIFVYALQAEARGVAGDVRSQLIKPYCAANFDMTDARIPDVVVQGLGDLTVEKLADVIGPLVSDGLITADDDIEGMLRKMLNVPPKKIAPRLEATGTGNPRNNPTNPGDADPPEPGDPEPDVVPQPNIIQQAQPIVIPITMDSGTERHADTVAEQLRQMAEAITNWRPEVPQLPPITLNLGGGRKKTIVLRRDDDGRIKETVTEEIDDEGGSSDTRTGGE